jgi:sigma54-dependent transcription regulator
MNIEELIKEQIMNIDVREMVQSEVRRLISDELKREIAKTTKERITAIIDTEIDIVMSKPVQTDDGWGKKESFQSFEDMFKTHFQKALNDSYGIKTLIGKHVKDECDRLVKQKTKEITEALYKTLNPPVSTETKAPF